MKGGAMKLSPLTAAVVVKSLKKAKRFYTAKLGLKVIDGMGHWVTVGQPRTGMRIHLCETKPQEKGNTGICFFADAALEKAYQALKKKGVKFSVPPAKRPWGVECRFLDIDGNEFWLMGK
jgi:catechol 2,3-dioxygenase-like lactoylglutathione lyase family enzyme